MKIFGNQRSLLQFSVGAMPHKAMLRAIELYGTVVAPAVARHYSQPVAPLLNNVEVHDSSGR